MIAEDAFSQWLGIKVLDIKPGFAKIMMDVRPEMNNEFRIIHAGIAYSLADSALAFASNSYGRVAIALETNISYMKKVRGGAILTTETEELSIGNTMGIYNITITNQENKKVALFRGTVYRTEEEHLKISDE